MIKTPFASEIADPFDVGSDHALAGGIQKGVPTKVVMNITGHNTEREFNKYVNISGERNAELFRQYWG